MTRLAANNDDFLCLAVSGQRFTFRHNIFKNLSEELPKIYPCSSGVELVFIDLLRELPPLSCPLLWDKEWADDPLARLLADWSGMVKTMRRLIDERIRPLLQRGVRVVAIFHGFGLNLLLHAAVTAEMSLDHPVIGEVYEAHGGLVKTFFRHFTPPTYLIAQADPVAVSGRMERESSALAAIPASRRIEFVRFEEAAIRHYEKTVPMQQPFNYIKASFNEDEMTKRAQEIIMNHIDKFQERAAA